MTTEPTGGDGAVAQQWRLRGFWFAWIWISWAVCLALLVGAVGLVVLGWSATGSVPPFVLVGGTLLLAIAAVIGWQLGGTAMAVTLHPDGAITVRRQRGALHTHVGRVRQVRPSILRSTFTPTVVETVDGRALLVHPRPERDELIAALLRRNPHIVVGT